MELTTRASETITRLSQMLQTASTERATITESLSSQEMPGTGSQVLDSSTMMIQETADGSTTLTNDGEDSTTIDRVTEFLVLR